METKYVRKEGLDTNNGTIVALAKLTIASAMTAASNNDTINIGEGALGAVGGIAAAGMAGWEAGKMIDSQFHISDTWGKAAFSGLTRDRKDMSKDQASAMDADTARMKADLAARRKAQTTIAEKGPIEQHVEAEAASAAAESRKSPPTPPEVVTPAPAPVAAPTVIMANPTAPNSNFREGTSVDDPLLDFLNMSRLSISI